LRLGVIWGGQTTEGEPPHWEVWRPRGTGREREGSGNEIARESGG